MSNQNELTAEERQVLDKLAEAHNLFVQLPTQHPWHNEEWIHHLHDLQRMILCRPTSRSEGLVPKHEQQFLITDEIRQSYLERADKRLVGYEDHWQVGERAFVSAPSGITDTYIGCRDIEAHPDTRYAFYTFPLQLIRDAIAESKDYDFPPLRPTEEEIKEAARQIRRDVWGEE